MRTLNIDGKLYHVPLYVSRRHAGNPGWRIAVAGIDKFYPDSEAGTKQGFHEVCTDLLELKRGHPETLRRLCPLRIDWVGSAYLTDVVMGLSNDDRKRTFVIEALEGTPARLTPMKLTDEKARQLFKQESLDKAFGVWCSKLGYTLSDLSKQDLARALGWYSVSLASKPDPSQMSLF